MEKINYNYFEDGEEIRIEVRNYKRTLKYIIDASINNKVDELIGNKKLLDIYNRSKVENIGTKYAVLNNEQIEELNKKLNIDANRFNINNYKSLT